MGCSRVLATIVGLGLITVAAMKLTARYQEKYVISEGVYYLAALSELVLGGVLLADKCRMLALWVVVALCGGGLAVHFLYVGRGESCGCLGGIRLFELQEFVALGLAGGMSMLALMWGREAVRTSVVDGNTVARSAACRAARRPANAAASAADSR